MTTVLEALGRLSPNQRHAIEEVYVKGDPNGITGSMTHLSAMAALAELGVTPSELDNHFNGDILPPPEEPDDALHT